jgi:AcrR family transcriptional regulator
MAEATPGQPARRPLPPGLDLLWGRRERGRRGPRPGLSPDAIVEAAMRLADAEGLEAVSMARVAAELGFTTMSLYRYVTNKDELLQLMWNASATGVEKLVIEGDDWRSRLRSWATIQRDMLDLHPWITQMPMAAPPVAPNSLLFVERGMETMDDTGLPGAEQLRIIGLISSFTLSEARMAADANRAAQEAQAAQSASEAQAAQPASQAQAAAAGGAATAGQGGGEALPPQDYEELLRELVDEPTYPRLHRLAWAPRSGPALTEREMFLDGLDTILDGVQAQIDRANNENQG